MFAATLGLVGAKLDLHANKKVTPVSLTKGPVRGVALLVAQALFRYHLHRGRKITAVIVGQGGKKVLKIGMLDFINSLPGYKATVDEHNPGQLNIKKIS